MNPAPPVTKNIDAVNRLRLGSAKDRPPLARRTAHLPHYGSPRNTGQGYAGRVANGATVNK